MFIKIYINVYSIVKCSFELHYIKLLISILSKCNDNYEDISEANLAIFLLYLFCNLSYSFKTCWSDLIALILNEVICNFSYEGALLIATYACPGAKMDSSNDSVTCGIVKL